MWGRSGIKGKDTSMDCGVEVALKRLGHIHGLTLREQEMILKEAHFHGQKPIHDIILDIYKCIITYGTSFKFFGHHYHIVWECNC